MMEYRRCVRGIGPPLEQEVTLGSPEKTGKRSSAVLTGAEWQGSEQAETGQDNRSQR
jgi:hypothetical protein